MAFFQMKYHSDALQVAVSVNVVIPEKASSLIGMTADGSGSDSFRTLYLLHGLSDDESIWERRTSIERYAADRGIAVVMPAVGRSWYTDTAYGAKYFTFLTDELPAVLRGYFRGMSDRREDNFIAGLSMGGYGAIKAAMTYPDRYAGCASLSGALEITNYTKRGMSDEWKGIFGFDLKSSADLIGTKHDVFDLAKKAAASGKPVPKIYLWCGEQDGLINDSNHFVALLDELNIEYRYDRSEGNHSWKWWDLHINDALDHILG